MLALDAILTFMFLDDDDDDDDEHRPFLWQATNTTVHDSECSLLHTVDDVRALFTLDALREVLGYNFLLASIIAAFESALAERAMTIDDSDDEEAAVSTLVHVAASRCCYALARALVHASPRAGARERIVASHLFLMPNSPRLTPTHEYLDFVSAIACNARVAMHATNYAHQCCRLLLAITLHHALALEWLASVQLLCVRSLVWWSTAHAERGVEEVGVVVLRYLIVYAALADNEEFVHEALARCRLPTLEHERTPFSYRRRGWYGACPFTHSFSCCEPAFTDAAIAQARRLLPAALHADVEAYRGH